MNQLLVDILPLKEGRTADEAVAHFEGLKDVFEKHGLKRSGRPLAALKTLRGKAKADVVNLWETNDAEASMKGMAADPDYQAHIAARDALFDLESATIILTQHA